MQLPPTVTFRGIEPSEFSVALAKRSHGRVMTGDREFKVVEPEIAIHWLPGRRE